MAGRTWCALAGLVCATALSGIAASDEVHWDYEGTDGPKHWGSLAPAFAACASGTEQSPVDLTGAQGSDLSSLAFDYTPGPITISNNGHTIQVDYAPGSGIVLDGARYELLQFHFHHVSEHPLPSRQRARGRRRPVSAGAAFGASQQQRRPRGSRRSLRGW